MTTQAMPIPGADLPATSTFRRVLSFRIHGVATGSRELRDGRPQHSPRPGIVGGIVRDGSTVATHAVRATRKDRDNHLDGTREAPDADNAKAAETAIGLTDDGRAEFQALRAEIIERLRAQQQGMQFTLMLLTALVAGAATLPGRVSEAAIYGFLHETAMLPFTLLALLFAGLSAVFAEQEVMISYAGGYIAKCLRMPWEFTRHGTLGFKRRTLVRAQAWTMLGAKYLLAAVPALLLWGISAFGLGSGTGIWRASAAPLVVWVSAALWILVGAVLIASATGVIMAVLSYRSIHVTEKAAPIQGPAGRHVLVAVLRALT